ncbi:MAG: hypothetical protein KF703_10820 [Actinobacteria bacterium]|nr:hypothetical protein [Actinomycetota bacterium]
MSRHPSRPRGRARASALLAAGLLVLAPACSAGGGGGAEGVATGPGTPSATGVAYLNRAAATTGDVQQLKVATTVTVRGVGSGELTTESTGEIDRAARRAHLELDASSLFGRFQGSKGLGADGGRMELVVDGDTAYLRSSVLATLLGNDTPWVSASRDQLGGPGGVGAGPQGDPTSFLGLLEGAGGSLTELGREDVRGVPTRHVSTVVDVAKALDQLPTDRYPGLADELEQLDGLASEAASYVTIPVEAWIDDDGHVRRFTLTLDFSPSAENAPELADASVVLTAELYDFDVPVDIAIPAAADVTTLDLAALLGGD